MEESKVIELACHETEGRPQQTSQPSKDKDKEVEEQRKKSRITAKMSNEPTLELATDDFTAALAAVPAEDWCRTWAADRTIMLRMTSKRVKALVDKVRPPAVLRWSKSFLDEKGNGTAAEKLKFVIRKLTVLTARSGCQQPHHHNRLVLE
jgi:hypothetical protein